MTTPADPSPSALAKWLGYAGLIPFVGLSISVWWLDSAARAQSLHALLAYGASIMGFLGAIHWGLTMRDPTPSSTLLAWGVMPSLTAWVALLLPARAGLWLVVLGLCVCLAVDQRVYPRYGLRAWLKMRFLLTAIASVSCAAAALV